MAQSIPTLKPSLKIWRLQTFGADTGGTERSLQYLSIPKKPTNGKNPKIRRVLSPYQGTRRIVQFTAMKQIENSPVKTQYNQITNRQASTIDSLDQANTARSPSTERYLAAQRTRLYSPIHNRPQDDRTPVPMQSTRARALMSPKLKAIFGRVGSGLIRRSNESPLSSKYR